MSRDLFATSLYVRVARKLVTSSSSAAAAAAHGRATHLVLATVLASAVTLAPRRASAEPSDDGYCEYVEGTAAADASTLVAPQLFAQFGYIEQSPYALTPSDDSSNLRVLGGVRYSLTNIYAGFATRARARAECDRHRALIGVTDTTAERALAARIAVYDDAQTEAQRILHDQETALQTRQGTEQEVLATRLRVEELRALAADARRELAAMPPADGRPLAASLSAYRAADAEVERSESKLRAIRAYDLHVRVGADRFLDGPSQDTQFFGVVELGVNLGALWTGGANSRAAAGRRRYAIAETQKLGGVTFGQLRSSLEAEQKLVEQTAALVADLDRQLAAVAQIAGDDGKRFRETLWFARVKASADLAYQRAHIDALREALAADVR